MNWTAVIPLRGKGERKTRLALRLNPEERRRSSEAMLAHVAAILHACPGVGEVALLSDLRPDNWRGGFFHDTGRGLNMEIGALAEWLAPKPLLVIHADLPLLSVADITTLLTEAAGGMAIAPDQHGTGTNAIALSIAGTFPFAFGPDSYARHIEAAGSGVRVVKRLGLSLDIDTPEDYDAALALGYNVQEPV